MADLRSHSTSLAGKVWRIGIRWRGRRQTAPARSKNTASRAFSHHRFSAGSHTELAGAPAAARAATLWVPRRPGDVGSRQVLDSRSAAHELTVPLASRRLIVFNWQWRCSKACCRVPVFGGSFSRHDRDNNKGTGSKGCHQCEWGAERLMASLY